MGAFAASMLITSSDTAASRATPDWPELRREHKPGCIWWWPGSAVDRENLTWNLEQLHAAGFGGGSVVGIYGVKGTEDRFLEFLSPEWVAMWNHAVSEADRLGMWLDLTPGSGWRVGGPDVPKSHREQQVAVKNGVLAPHSKPSRVKRAGPGGAGFAVNPYSVNALKRYLERFDHVLADGTVRRPRAFYHDSFEYTGNWCPELPEAFATRHGYDLADFAAALDGSGDPDIVTRVKHDYRETLADLHLRFFETMQAWAEGYGAGTREQAHGAPANLLDLYAAASIPETEIFGASVFAIPGVRRETDNVRQDLGCPLVNRFASSAAHVAGRRLVSSESFTWLRNHFRAALSQIKPEIDHLLLNGINHILYHGTCYSPKDAAWPGWLFYASTQANPRNAVWRDIGALNTYIARCQAALQSGRPDNDILLYWPVHDLWMNKRGLHHKLTVHHHEWISRTACGKTAQWLLDHGFAFDFVSDRQLSQVRVADGRVETGATRYQAVLIPPVKHMPPETLAQLAELARQGAAVVVQGALPSDVPGLGNLQSRRNAFAQARTACRDAGVTVGRDLGAELAAAGIAPEPMVQQGLQFIRRAHDDGTDYFVANMSSEAVDGWIHLARAADSALVMDPMQGGVSGALLRGSGGNAAAYLQLLPGETRILRLLTNAGNSAETQAVLQPAAPPILLPGEWVIEFIDGAPALPRTFRTSKLASWTDREDRECKRFAGTARYSLTFTLPEQEADDWRLDLGDVRESARVSVNGTPTGTLVSVPFNLRIGPHLREGANTLDIEVTNLSANRLRDLDRRKVRWRIFHDINIVTHNYKPFDASDWPLAPSGLLGPVTLTPLRNQAP